jgi:F-type H+-transporting ATPase subunit delta
MISSSIARRYAKALFALADEQGRIEQWSESLQSLRGVLASSRELRDALGTPAYTREQQRGVVTALAAALALPEEVRNILLLLADRGRLTYATSVVDRFRDLADERLGRVRAKVTSAVPLSAGEAGRIAETLAGITKGQVMLETAVDPSLLGGVVAQVGSLVYDGSVRAQLEELRRTMKQQ